MESSPIAVLGGANQSSENAITEKPKAMGCFGRPWTTSDEWFATAQVPLSMLSYLGLLSQRTSCIYMAMAGSGYLATGALNLVWGTKDCRNGYRLPGAVKICGGLGHLALAACLICISLNTKLAK